MSDRTLLYKVLPKTVRVGCFVYRVEIGSEREHDVTETFGFTNFLHRIISLRPSMSKNDAANTFLHEVIHAVNSAYGLHRDSEESPTEEEYTRQIANGLCAFFQDNPEATRWFHKANALETTR